MITPEPLPREAAREWLKRHGIKNPNYRDFKKYLAREPSAKQDSATRAWTVALGSPDPRRPDAGGRPRSLK